MSLKAIIFDVDDTLVYTMETAYQKTFIAGKRSSGIELKKEDFLKLYNKMSFEECIVQWFPHTVSAFLDEYSKLDMAYLHIVDIHHISTIGARHSLLKGIITNSTEIKTKRKLRNGINEFDFVYYNAKKPSQETIDDVKVRFNIKSTEILYVGDSEKDYQFATTAGVHFCAVNTGVKQWNQSNIIILENVSDIERAILQINE